MKRLLLTATVLIGCAGGMGTPGIPIPYGGSRPEDRVVLGDLSHVTAIAAAYDRVAVAYPTALGIWRPLERRWDVPRRPPARDVAMMREVVGALIDPADQSIWLAARSGWLHYQPDIDRWESGTISTPVIGIATEVVPPSRGIWFRTATGWYLLARFSQIAIPATPVSALTVTPTIDDAIRENPAIRNFSAIILQGPRMVNGRFTAVAKQVNGPGWFLGTSNRGVTLVDDLLGVGPPLTIGIQGEQVGAVALSEGGVWVATDAEPLRPGALTRVLRDLSLSVAVEGPRALGLPFGAVRAFLVCGDTLWLATDQGVMRHYWGPDRITTWNEGHGIPDRRMLSLARIGNTMFAGGMRGIVAIDNADKVTRRDPDFQQPVYALHARGDTLFVGSAIGLFTILPRDERLQEPTGVRSAIPLRTPVLGVGSLGDTLVAMTTERLVWRDPLTGAWDSGPDLSGQLGQLVAVSFDRGVIWVAGERGVGAVGLATAALRPMLVPNDLPGSVTSIVAERDWLWIGTRAGLVRVRLSGR